MLRHLYILIGFLLLAGSLFAESELPVIEIKADRTMIYPQRMELTGEESLMDILQMVPELMIANYEDVISSYNLRIDNCPMNGDTRLIRFDDRNKLLTYFTQQYLDHPSDMSRKVMGRARFFHTFNDLGTELLIVGGYQYNSDQVFSNKLPLYIVELNTPLFSKQLSPC